MSARESEPGRSTRNLKPTPQARLADAVSHSKALHSEDLRNEDDVGLHLVVRYLSAVWHHSTPTDEELRRVRLIANLRGVDLTRANLRHVSAPCADLINADLHRANLHYAHLESVLLCGADLTGANLTNANLVYTNLTGADLTGANLRRADLTGADLTGANLRMSRGLKSAKLKDARWSERTQWPDELVADMRDRSEPLPDGRWRIWRDLKPAPQARLTDAASHSRALHREDMRNEDAVRLPRAVTFLSPVWSGSARADEKLRLVRLMCANLRGVDLTRANLRHASAPFADLINADLYRANLHDADLGSVLLYGADLTGADLTNAYLIQGNLIGVDLTGADLTGAKLIGVDLIGADLHRANLTGANLTGADLQMSWGLKSAKLKNACWSERTQWPDELVADMRDRSEPLPDGRWRISLPFDP